MEKLKMHSPDLTAEKIRQIAELLPNCVTESRGEDGVVRLRKYARGDHPEHIVA